MIEAVMQKLCETGAHSVERYVAISGCYVEEMPECFMPAFVMDHLDEDGKLFGGMAMTMETSVKNQ
jgi:hypothetical protein